MAIKTIGDLVITTICIEKFLSKRKMDSPHE